ncbi:Hypothetical protein CINCED_3A002068 [Cinara cedri]|uniref:Uncharacterized protein n=1 Tax=Cinara cedri TaxID=506608 RepID=A0A5E4MJQ2_9HEMI|nr:Hypothetical protein CINCED_3A002068 [Cinara cedri]
MWSSSTTEDEDGVGNGVSCPRDVDVEDHFEPSLFAECDTPSSPLWSDDVHSVFLAANLLMFYLNLARLQSSMTINDTHPLPVTVIDRGEDNDISPPVAANVTTATAKRRLSGERLPGEPGPSTDGERSRTADATTTTQGHHYRSNSRPSPQPTQELARQQQQAATTSTGVTDDTMITVAASGSRAPKPKPLLRLVPPSLITLFPVDVTDRLRSSDVSSHRPRQYGRRRSVQEAVNSAVALQQRQQQSQSLAAIANTAAVATESDMGLTAASGTAAAAVDDPLQEQEPPSRLVATLRFRV